MDRQHIPANRGFTLVELLVVIAIIGILVGLLLPAVQAAREAARRMSCSNNLKNLGLAVLNHHDVQGHFPVSMGSFDPNEAPGEEMPCVGWILQILPQLEEGPLYDQFVEGGAFEGNYRIGICRRPREGFGLGSLRNGISVPELMQNQLSILQCTSDESVTQLSDKQFQWVGCSVALTSSTGVLGDTWLGMIDGGVFNNDASQYQSGVYTESSGNRDCHRDPRCRGLFFRHSFRRPVKLSKVTDGTSKTMMIGEDVPEFNRHSTAFYSNGDWCSCNIPLNFGLSTPTSMVEDFSLAWWDAQGFRSRHSGAAYFLWGDGHVALMSEAVNRDIYRALSTRKLGEVTEVDQ